MAWFVRSRIVRCLVGFGRKEGRSLGAAALVNATLKKKKNCVHARLRIRESFDIPKVYGREKEKKKKVAARTIIDRIGRRRGEWGEKKNPRKKIDVYTKKKKKQIASCV